MRVANVEGRLAVLGPDGVVDVAEASAGAFGPEPQDVFDVWPDFRRWADGARPGGGARSGGGAAVDPARLGPVVPRPRQIFAIGLNYVDHAAESGLTLPSEPMVFTKFASCLTGPAGEIALGGDTVDWEIELVVVIGRPATRVEPADAWDHVAGLTIGQDLSDRTLQMRGSPPQFSLGKSRPGFGPIGPWLTTLDEVRDPDNLELTCAVNGEVVQRGHTKDLAFPVPALVSYLSGVCPLSPGDLIFTGTPAGVGLGRTPPRFLAPGDTLDSAIAGLGTMRHRLTP